MFIPTFSTAGSDDYSGLPLPDNETNVFAGQAAKFLKQAKADNKTRLVIDLSANGGGNTINGWNMFKLLFPKTPIWQSNRFRNHEFSRLVMKALTNYTQDYDDVFTYAVARHFAWDGQVAPNQGPLNWTSYEDFTGGADANLTALTGFNNFTANNIAEQSIQGYGNNATTFSEPPFSPENILIITDGYCASTCSIFTYLLTQEGGVNNTLVFGGRPPLATNSSTSTSTSKIPPMQLVGGTRGTEAYEFSQLSDAAARVLSYIEERRSNGSESTLSETEFTQFKDLMPMPLANLSLQCGGGSVNLRNGYDRYVQTNTPLEFLSQEASCRLYYTAENVLRPETAWRDAVGAVWGGKGCAARSEGRLGMGGGNTTAAVSSSDEDKSTQQNAAGASGIGRSWGMVLVGCAVGMMALM